MGKFRGIVVIDYELDSYKQVASEEQSLEDAIRQLVKGNPRVVRSEVDIKERRGDKAPDIKKMKLRSS
jgi:hypothetical protein